MERKMHGCMKFMLHYNDYFVCIVNIELVFLSILSKPLDQVEWRSDQPKPKFISTDFMDICLFLYLNFLFMKQIIQHLYYDYTYSKAVQEAEFFTIDFQQNIKDGKPKKKDTSLKISPMMSLIKYAYYFCIDFVITLLLQWVLGWPLIEKPGEAIKFSAVCTVLLRESISECKLPESQKKGENTFRIPIGVMNEDGKVESLDETTAGDAAQTS